MEGAARRRRCERGNAGEGRSGSRGRGGTCTTRYMMEVAREERRLSTSGEEAVSESQRPAAPPAPEAQRTPPHSLRTPPLHREPFVFPRVFRCICLCALHRFDAISRPSVPRSSVSAAGAPPGIEPGLAGSRTKRRPPHQGSIRFRRGAPHAAAVATNGRSPAQTRLEPLLPKPHAGRRQKGAPPRYGAPTPTKEARVETIR